MASQALKYIHNNRNITLTLHMVARIMRPKFVSHNYLAEADIKKFGLDKSK